MPFLYDPFMLLLIPPLILALYARSKVQKTFAEYSQRLSASGTTGADAARRILRGSGPDDVKIERVAGSLTDHYDPRKKVLRLSEPVYNSRSLAALGVAAHEAGHAVQHGRGYVPLKIRSVLYPVAAFGNNLGPILFVIGLVLMLFMGGKGEFAKLVAQAGILLFAGGAFFTVVTLPVEFNASRRALVMLVDQGIVTPRDEAGNFITMAQGDPAHWPPHIHPPRDVREARRDQGHPTVPDQTAQAPCVHTVGHGNVGIEDWLGLLKEREVEVLVDLRSVPYSRHVPQANRDALETAVKAQGMKYLFLGNELGGRPKSGVPRDGAGRPDYAQMAQRQEFKEGIQRLLCGITEYRVCLLCSEEDPARCHRALLVGRELVKEGVEVRHIRGDGTEESQDQAERRAPGRQESLFERGKS